MVEDLKNGIITKENLRKTDSNMLSIFDPRYNNYIQNEEIRINLSIALKELAYSIRTGTFENKLSSYVNEKLNLFKMPGNKFEEDNKIQAILETKSFKPTLISHNNNNLNIFNNTINPIINPMYPV
jgi:hypothetical protein